MRSSLCLVVFSAFLLAGCASETAADGIADEANITGGSETLALAAELPEHCASPEIRRVDRTVTGTSKHFAYGYRYKAATNPGAPVMVFLPGGPGSSSSEMTPDFLPEGWGYLMTDPRGVGCNTLATVPDGELAGTFWKTSELADDVIAAIEKEKLETFVLFGVSYGTLLGTTVAHELEARRLPAPRGVVLEGVLGRAFRNDFMGAEYIAQWDRIRGVLPADVLTELDTKDAPYGIDAEGWSRLLMGFLMHGPNPVANHVAALTTSQPAEVQAQALGVLKSLAADRHLADPASKELYRQVACREIADTVPASDLDVVFRRGKLVRNSAEEGTKCNGLRVTAPYDSAKLQFGAKVYYFVGDSDVATPPWQGAYHYDNHRGPAVKVTIKAGGHNPLRLDQGSCAPQVMASIATGGADLSTVLTSCPQPVQVATK